MRKSISVHPKELSGYDKREIRGLDKAFVNQFSARGVYQRLIKVQRGSH